MISIWDGDYLRLKDGRLIGPIRRLTDPANGRVEYQCPKTKEWFDKGDISHKEPRA